MKKLLILLLAALMCAASAHADSTQRIDHGALPLDETWTDRCARTNITITPSR